MRRTVVQVIAPVVLAGLLVAGCGGGGKKNTAATTASGAGATTKATTTAASTDAASTTSDLSGITSAANCQQLAGLGAQFSQAMTGSAAGDTKKVAQLLQEFAAKTPADIRPDFEVVAAAYVKIADALGNVKIGATPDAGTLSKLQKLAGQIDEPKVTKAWQHIGAWAKRSCGA